MDQSSKGQIRSIDVAGKQLNIELGLLSKHNIKSVMAIAALSFPKSWNENEFAYFIEHDCGLCLGVFSQGQLLGYLLCLLVQGELDIVSIAVSPEFRRAHLAQILLEEAWGDKRIQSAFLEVDAANLIAIKLYEKVGFEKYGIRRKYYEGKRDAVVMKKIKR